MAAILPSSIIPASKLQSLSNKQASNTASVPFYRRTVKCESSGEEKWGLRIGSPVIVVEAPATLKTADSMPSLKLNSGQIKPGDVGRIIARKPKDVWAVRLKIGTYLIDGKHFRPLDLQE